jgi:hypothetical protein
MKNILKTLVITVTLLTGGFIECIPHISNIGFK